MRLRTVCPDPDPLRSHLYTGEVFLLPPTEPSRALVDEVTSLLEVAFEGKKVRDLAQALPNAELFRRMGALRRTLYLEAHFQSRVKEVIRAYGFDPAWCAFDPLRLRVITHGGATNPAAQAVYYPHRDTWYGHPQGIVTWWIPLDDLSPEETFVFHPDQFSVPVPNDSEVFDYDDWVSRGWDLKIGWQDPEAGRTARYPRALVDADPRNGIGFACQRAQNLLFSGAHFHQTRPQESGRTRFSLDFRVVHLPDHQAGLGAPNVDNRSRGSALRDYTHPHV